MAYKDEILSRWQQMAVDLAVAAAFIVLFFAAIAVCDEIGKRDCPAGDHYSFYDSDGNLVCRDGEKQ